MCYRGRHPCRNRLCDGFAQTLELISCSNKPNCTIKFTRVPRELRSEEVYCATCMLSTAKKRTNRLKAQRRFLARERTRSAKALESQASGAVREKARSAKAPEGQANDAADEKGRSAKALEGQANSAVNDSAPTEVKQQAESSMTAQNSNAVTDAFPPNSAHPPPLSEEVPFLSSFFFDQDPIWDTLENSCPSSPLLDQDPMWMWHMQDAEKYQQELQDMALYPK